MKLNVTDWTRQITTISNELFNGGKVYFEYRVWASRRDYLAGNAPKDFTFCSRHCNNHLTLKDARHYMQGLTQGMRCKYAEPMAALYLVVEDSEQLITTQQ